MADVHSDHEQEEDILQGQISEYICTVKTISNIMYG